MANKSLYVGNLSYSTTEATLREIFAQFQPAEIRLIADKGFGFVEVPEDKAAEAITALNGREVDGRAIIVNEARPRGEGGSARGGGGGGFGGGGGGRGGGGRRRW